MSLLYHAYVYLEFLILACTIYILAPKKARRSSHKNHIRGPRKRTEEDDVRFAQSFEKLVAGFKDNHTCKIENYGGK